MTFWRENVRAVISEVVMAYCDRGRWTKVDVETVIK
jgi:hypothetical protein